MAKSRAQNHKAYFTAKRLLDIASGVTGILIFGIPMIVVYIANKLEAPGPAVFVQMRAGKGGRGFRMYKFASMITRTEEQEREFLEKLAKEQPELWERYKANNFKTTEDDPRITKFGKFLRKSSLDELPQFLNVLKGEMSLVGPRAYKKDELKYQLQTYPHLRTEVEVLLTVKPGITGSWQISGRSEIDFPERVKMDAEYARRRSLLEDLTIIVKTPLVMIRGKGAC